MVVGVAVVRVLVVVGVVRVVGVLMVVGVVVVVVGVLMVVGVVVVVGVLMVVGVVVVFGVVVVVGVGVVGVLIVVGVLMLFGVVVVGVVVTAVVGLVVGVSVVVAVVGLVMVLDFRVNDLTVVRVNRRMVRAVRGEASKVGLLCKRSAFSTASIIARTLFDAGNICISNLCFGSFPRVAIFFVISKAVGRAAGLGCTIFPISTSKFLSQIHLLFNFGEISCIVTPKA